MSKKYLIGLDIGTSGAKCIIVDDAGKVVASSTQEYPLYTPKPGWAEQDPKDWWDACVRGLKVILPKSGVNPADIAGVSYSGQMHGLVALDADNEVIRPAILWCDQRTQAQCDWITEKAGGLKGLLTYTNNQMLTGYTGGKILWLKEEEPDNFAKMKLFVCPKDYIRYRMTGTLGIDMSDASGTGFFDVRNRKWSDGLIELAGLDKAIFPEAHESTELAGRVTAAAAAETGLPEGLNSTAAATPSYRPPAAAWSSPARWAWSSAPRATWPWRWTSMRTTPTARCSSSAATSPAPGWPWASR